MLVKITTLDLEYLSSDRVQYEEYYYTLFPSAIAISKNRKDAGVANL
jgi:hypothetical protein